MIKRPPSLSALLIALAAIAGTLSLGSPASACSDARAEAPRGCCSDRKMPASCGCCGTESPVPAVDVTGSAERVISPPYSLDHASPMAGSCECGVGEPSSPGQDPARKTASERDERTGVEVDLQAFVAVLSLRSLPAGTLARRIDVFPHTPLYLRTSRLLI